MRSFPRIVIELGSHTDSRGTDLYNEKLSFNRAKSVVDYLISKGIEPDRLVAKGYGEKVPRVLERNFVIPGCNTKYKFLKGIEMTDAYINSLQGGKCEFEAAHQLNRRTTFIVLREDYIPGKTKSSKPVNIEMINK
jgi:peptidoglycan-associated lipoprotein